MQRTVAHTVFARNTPDETLSSSDQASSSLFHIGLSGQSYLHVSPKSGVRQPLDPTLHSSAIRCVPIISHFLTTSAEKKSVRMSAATKAKSLATRHRRRLLQNQEERARHVALTSLAHSTPRTHYPTGPSRAKRPPISASSIKVGESPCLHHCEVSFHQLEPTLSHRSSTARPQLGL